MLDTVKSLLEDCIKDLYSAENQLTKALPKMAKAATSPKLKEAFQSHLEETKGHVERLQTITELLEISPGGKKCKGMEGLIEEGKEVLEEDGDETVIDAALVCAAQKVEHYEISSYSSAIALAETLGEQEIVSLLSQTLEEESTADETLSEICETELLRDAPKDDSERESEGDEQKRKKNSKKKTAKKTTKR